MNNAAIDLSMETLVEKLRMELGVPEDIRPDPIDILRRMRISGRISSFEFVDSASLPNDDARWNPDSRSILVRSEVAGKAEAGSEEDTFTIFHEMGHAVLNHPVRNRRTGIDRLQFGRLIEGDERDADRFARTFMAPIATSAVTQDTTLEEFRSTYGMPTNQAVVRLEELKRFRRHQSGTRREVPLGSPRTIDTGDYDEAMPEMLRNAWRWNS